MYYTYYIIFHITLYTTLYIILHIVLNIILHYITYYTYYITHYITLCNTITSLNLNILHHHFRITIGCISEFWSISHQHLRYILHSRQMILCLLISYVFLSKLRVFPNECHELQIFEFSKLGTFFGCFE